MAAALGQRVAAVAQFLASVSCASGYEEAVLTQEKDLTQRINAATLDIQRATELAKTLDAMPPPSRKRLTEVILDRVGKDSPAAPASKPAQRASLQDWQHLPSYFPRSIGMFLATNL